MPPARSRKGRPAHTDPAHKPQTEAAALRTSAVAAAEQPKLRQRGVFFLALFTSVALLPSWSGAVQELRQIPALRRAAAKFERRVSVIGVRGGDCGAEDD